MASSQSSRDMRRGRDRQPPAMGSPRPRHRSESRRLSDGRRPVKEVTRERDYCPGVLHEGEAVQVFSRTADAWVIGVIVKFVESQCVHVEYKVGEGWYGKLVDLRPEHLIANSAVGVQTQFGDTHRKAGWMPGHVVSPVSPGHITVEFDFQQRLYRKHLSSESERLMMLMPLTVHHSGTFSEHEAFDVLRSRVVIRYNQDDLRPVARAVRLAHVRNNSFATLVPLTQDAEIEYHGAFDEDVLLKVYTVEEEQYPQAQHRRRTDRTSLVTCQLSQSQHHRYALQGYVHAMQRPRFPVVVKAGCFVGFVIHKDLNKDWIWQMKAEAPERYNNFMSRSSPGGWSERSDPLAKHAAEDADYLISFTTGNKEENDEMLAHISMEPLQGPHGFRNITFCTDRSLGFGGHFDGDKGLYLAKHGFGQPIAPGGWFDEYEKASTQTKHGVLILNYSEEYMKSEASRLELTKIPEERLNLMLPRTPDSGERPRIIVPWTMPLDASLCREGFFRSRANAGLLSALGQLDLKGAERLLQKRADPNRKFVWGDVDHNLCTGFTGGGVGLIHHVYNKITCPLHVAATVGLPEFTKLLISGRADINWKDQSEDSALRIAFSKWRNHQGNDRLKVFEQLLDAGAFEPEFPPNTDVPSAIERLRETAERKEEELVKLCEKIREEFLDLIPIIPDDLYDYMLECDEQEDEDIKKAGIHCFEKYNK